MTTRVYKPLLKPQVLIGTHLLGIDVSNTDELIAVLQKGISFKVLETLGAQTVAVGGSLKANPETARLAGLRMAQLIGISESTYQRRKLEKKLLPKESEGVYRYAALLARASEVFTTPEAARQWLNQPVRALGDKIPLEYARTEVGAALVMQILGRIEHGVVS